MISIKLLNYLSSHQETTWRPDTANLRQGWSNRFVTSRKPRCQVYVVLGILTTKTVRRLDEARLYTDLFA
jgi:hypothetical protein